MRAVTTGFPICRFGHQLVLLPMPPNSLAAWRALTKLPASAGVESPPLGRKMPNNRDALTGSHWQQVVNAATHTAIISTDPKGVVTSWNSGAERIFRWSEAEMIGQSLDRLFPS